MSLRSGLAHGVVLAALGTAVSGCGKQKTIDEARAESAPVAQPVAPAAAAPAAAPAPAPPPDPAEALMVDDDPAEEGGGGKGAKKWRDTGVYLDGKPVGVLSFGELPIGLRPIFVEERGSAEIEPGSKSPGFTIIKTRRYRFTDYLRALGVNLAHVKTIHIMGPKFTDTVVASGADLRGPRGKQLLFRFGSEVGGKPIPVVPFRFGNGRSPDKITAVMIYAEKPAPEIVFNVGMVLDGKPISEVPYYGAPLRGGVRIYKDDRLVAHIKRPLLRETDPVRRDADLTPHWQLTALLDKAGVSLADVEEAYVIRHQRREEKLSGPALAAMTFMMPEKGSNQLLLGDQKIVTMAIALHTRALQPSELPFVLPEEDF